MTAKQSHLSLVGLIFRSRDTTLGGVPRVQFKIAEVKRRRDTQKTIPIRSGPRAEWYPIRMGAALAEGVA